MVKLVLFCSLLTFAYCSTNDSNSKNESNKDTISVRAVLIDTSLDDGWGGDIRFPFTVKSETDSSIIYTIYSKYKDKKIGFVASVPKEGSTAFTFQSIGSESDNFLRLLKQLYLKEEDTLSKLNNTTKFMCFHMGNEVDSTIKNKQGNSSIIHFCKLFFKGKSEDDYAELYFNINDQQNWVELKEKDFDYRSVIIKALTSR